MQHACDFLVFKCDAAQYLLTNQMPYVCKIHLCQDPEAARHETRGTFFKCLPKDAGFGKRAAKKESNSKKIAEKITNTVHYTAVIGRIRRIFMEVVKQSILDDMLANQDQDTSSDDGDDDA